MIFKKNRISKLVVGFNQLLNNWIMTLNRQVLKPKLILVIERILSDSLYLVKEVTLRCKIKKVKEIKVLFIN